MAKLPEDKPASFAPGWSHGLQPLTLKIENALFHVAGYLLDSILVYQTIY
jgi:hypothetical protein